MQPFDECFQKTIKSCRTTPGLLGYGLDNRKLVLCPVGQFAHQQLPVVTRGLPLGDVADHGGIGRDRAKGIKNRGVHKFDINFAAIAFEAHRLGAHRFPGQYLRALGLKPLHFFLRHKDRFGLSYDFIGRIAEELFSSLVPGLNCAIEPHADDGVA